jgi:hypothetical protein
VKLIFLTVVAIMLTLAGPALGYVNIYATCEGDSATITVSIVNDYDNEYVGVVVSRRTVGLCDEPVLISPEPVPMPVHTIGDRSLAVQTTFTVPIPHRNVHYEFIARAVDLSGALVIPQGGTFYYPPGHLSDIAASGEAPAMRGVMIITGSMTPGYYNIATIPCQDGCWGDLAYTELVWGVSEEHPLYVNAVPGVVDFIGVFNQFDGMPGSDMTTYTDVRPAPEGACGPVPTAVTSWGELKAMYR